MNEIIVVDTPSNFTRSQKEQFLILLKEQNQVENPTIDKINSCELLCMIYDNQLAIGIGALKNISKSSFDKADLAKLKNKYDLELGYLYVLNRDEYRGKKIGKKICSELLKKVSFKNVFATTEEEEENPMKHILQKCNFVKTGQTFVGSYSKKNIGLYLLTRDN